MTKTLFNFLPILSLGLGLLILCGTVICDLNTNADTGIDRRNSTDKYAISETNEFPRRIFPVEESGYLPGEGEIGHLTTNEGQTSVQNNVPFETNYKLDIALRSKRDIRKTTVDENGMETIVIASLLPENDTKLFSIKKVRPAIEIAIEKMNPLLAHHNRTLVVKFRDSKCDIAEGMNELINFYIHDEIDVILGPCCDYAIAPCARQVPFWNIPLLTAGGVAADFGSYKNSTFYTMTRLGSNFRQLTQMIIKTLQYHKWNKVRLIYEPTGERNVSIKHCYLAANDIHYGIMFSEEARNVKQDYKKFERREEVVQNMEEYFSLDIAGTGLLTSLPRPNSEQTVPVRDIRSESALFGHDMFINSDGS